MPLYDYRCQACDALFERNISIDRSEDRVECGCGRAAVRVIRRVASLRGLASEGARRADLPTSMRAVGGSRERVAELQRVEEAISRRESAGHAPSSARLPVLSHEGRGAPVFMTPRAVGEVTKTDLAQ